MWKENKKVCKGLSLCMSKCLNIIFYNSYSNPHIQTLFIILPCASSNQSLPVMAPTVDVDVSRYAVAAVAGESVLTVALFGRRLVPLHRQVVVGHPQLSVSRLWVQPERLTFGKKCVVFRNAAKDWCMAEYSSPAARTVSFELRCFAAAVSRLVYGLHDEDVLGSALKTMHGVVVLLDVWYNHPAVGRVAQT